MYPTIWGPAMWHSIFCILEEAPDGQVPQEYLSFFESFKVVLPCEKCRRHYTEYIAKNPLPNTRESLKDYFWTLRDYIAMRPGP